LLIASLSVVGWLAAVGAGVGDGTGCGETDGSGLGVGAGSRDVTTLDLVSLRLSVDTVDRVI
jgi:hypothetical protein